MRYVLIGGTACELIMNQAGLRFRATKDLDIVLCIESLDAEFARAFWAFVKAAGYRVQESAEGQSSTTTRKTASYRRKSSRSFILPHLVRSAWP